jgi:hypothetical protein
MLEGQLMTNKTRISWSQRAHQAIGGQIWGISWSKFKEASHRLKIYPMSDDILRKKIIEERQKLV